ncbi:unnamed protein product [Effrenium voratum]|nr:unnamed protein product [Effrenium voratum]
MHMLHACMCMHVCAYEHAMPARRPSHGCTAAAWPMPGAAGLGREAGGPLLDVTAYQDLPIPGKPDFDLLGPMRPASFNSREHQGFLSAAPHGLPPRDRISDILGGECVTHSGDAGAAADGNGQEPRCAQRWCKAIDAMTSACVQTWMNDPMLARRPVAQVAERNRHAAPILLDVTRGDRVYAPDD